MSSTLKFLPAKPGTCAMCATDHPEYAPHNYWSLFYQMRFKQKYGREATHADCVAHLSPEYYTRGYQPGQVTNMAEIEAAFTRLCDAYKALLEERELRWSEPAETIPEPYAVN